jgi:hypothetical protein
MHQAGVFWGSVGVAALLILAGIYALMQQATNAVTDFADQYAELQRASLEGHPHYYKTNAVDDNGLMAFGDKKTGTVELPFPDQWKFNGNSGQRVSIEAFSIDGAFDPILYLYDPAGHLLAINDDIRPGVNTNARLRITLPEDGRYSILICACYGPGRYRLELE